MFDTEEMQNDTNFEERGILQDTHLVHGDFKMPSWPVRVDGAPPYLIQPIAILTHARGDSGFVQRTSPPSGQPMLNKGESVTAILPLQGAGAASALAIQIPQNPRKTADQVSLVA